jgi:hypothetical protein
LAAICTPAILIPVAALRIAPLTIAPPIAIGLASWRRAAAPLATVAALTAIASLALLAALATVALAPFASAFITLALLASLTLFAAALASITLALISSSLLAAALARFTLLTPFAGLAIAIVASAAIVSVRGAVRRASETRSVAATFPAFSAVAPISSVLAALAVPFGAPTVSAAAFVLCESRGQHCGSAQYGKRRNEGCFHFSLAPRAQSHPRRLGLSPRS